MFRVTTSLGGGGARKKLRGRCRVKGFYFILCYSFYCILFYIIFLFSYLLIQLLLIHFPGNTHDPSPALIRSTIQDDPLTTRYEHSLLQGGGRGSWLTSVWPGTLHTGVMGLGYSNIILKGFGRWTEVCIDPRVIFTAVGPIVLQFSETRRCT